MGCHERSKLLFALIIRIEIYLSNEIPLDAPRSMFIIMHARSEGMAMLGSNQSDDLSENLERGWRLSLSLILFSIKSDKPILYLQLNFYTGYSIKIVAKDPQTARAFEFGVSH